MKRKLGKKARRALLSKGRSIVRADDDGRVHLALHRDPVSGEQRVELESALFETDWQNDVAAATASTAYASLAGGPSVSRTVALARKVMASTSLLTDGLLARAPAGSVACKAGCDHCCYQAVGVTAPEALAVYDFLKNALTPAKLAGAAARVAAAYERTRGLSSAERFSPEYPCVFLESGRCSIYEVRPLSCRGMNSLDASECAKRLHDARARSEFLSNGAGSHSFIEPIRAAEAVSAGLQLGLSELCALDMRPLDLIAALHLLFTRGETVARDWIAGDTSFETARGGENPSPFAAKPA